MGTDTDIELSGNLKHGLLTEIGTDWLTLRYLVADTDTVFI